MITYCKERYQRIQVSRDVKSLFNVQLLTKAFASFKHSSDQRKFKQYRRNKAEKFWQKHSGSKCKQRIFASFFENLVFCRQKRWAFSQYLVLQKYKCFGALKVYFEAMQKKHEQFTLVRSFYKCQLANKALKLWKHSISQSQVLRQQNIDKLLLQRKCNVFKAMQKRLLKQKIPKAVSSGPQVLAAMRWLELSFGDLMAQIWLEFPKQKLDMDPKTFQRLSLLNFMGLSKRPRYRKFFLYANSVIRHFIIRKAFTAMIIKTQKRRVQSFKIQQFKKRVIYTAIMRVLMKKVAARRYLEDKETLKLDNLKALCFFKLFQTTHKLRKLRQLHNSYIKHRLLEKKKHSLKTWRYLTRKVRALTECEAIHNTLGQQRTQAKYLAFWLQKLHIKLKVKHLRQLATKFTKKKIGKRYLNAWIQACIKQRQISQKAGELQKIQEQSTLGKCWDGFQIYLNYRQNKKIKNLKAQQEYIYWLGKRVMTFMRVNANQRQTMQQLKQLAQKDYKIALERKVLSALFTYTSYNRQRLHLDKLVTQKIHQQIKKKYLHRWSKAFGTSVGFTSIESIFKHGQLHIGFNVIKRKMLVQDAQVALHRKQKPQRIILAALNCLKTFATKQKHFKQVETYFREKMKMQMFDRWMSRCIQEQTKIKQFLWLFLAIKNELAGRVFKALIINLKMRKQKQNAIQLRKKGLLIKALQSISLRVQRRRRADKISSVISNKKRSKGCRKIFQIWLAKQKYKQYLRNCLKDIQRSILAKKFAHLQSYGMSQCNKRDHILSLRTEYLSIKVRNALQKFKANTDLIVLTRKTNDEASNYHEHYLCKKAAQAWINHYKSKQFLISLYLHKKRVARYQSKKRFFSRWLQNPKAQNAIEKVKASQKINKCLNKIDVRNLLMKWVKETNFLIKLSEVEMQGITLFQQKQKVKALKKLFSFAKTSIFDREKSIQTKLYANKKLKVNTFAAIYKYKENHIHRREQNRQADAFIVHSLLIKTLKSFQINFINHREISVTVAALRQQQIKIYCPQILFYWLKRTQAIQNNRNFRQRAFQFRVRTLLVKAIQSLLESLEQNKHKIYLHELATRFNRAETQNKGLRALLWYLIHRRERNEKKAFLFQTVQTIDMGTTLKACFSQLAIEAENGRHMNLKATLIRNKRYKHNAIKALQVNLKQNLKLRLQKFQLESINQMNITRNYFQKWIQQLAFKAAINAAEATHQQQNMQKTFNLLRKHAELRKKAKMLLKIRSVTLAVKAFQSLRRNIFNRRVKYEKHLVAQAKYYQWLQLKTLQGFAKYQIRLHNAQQLYIDSQLAKTRRYFAAWENVLQLKLWRKNFFNSCYRFIVKKFLQRWREQTQTKQLQINVQATVQRREQQILSLVFAALQKEAHTTILLRTVFKRYNQRVWSTLQMSFQKLHSHMLEDREEKGQMLKIIKIFERNRPENLLLFQKAFLQMNTGYNGKHQMQMQTKVCSTTLAKYVFDKWTNVLPKLRRESAQRKQAVKFYRDSYLFRCWIQWRRRFSEKTEKLQLTMILQSNRHTINLAKCFDILKSYSKGRKQRQYLAQSFSQSLRLKSMQSSFFKWYNNYQDSQTLKHTVMCINDERDIKLMQKAINRLRYYTQRQRWIQEGFQRIVSTRGLKTKHFVFQRLLKFQKCCQKRNAQQNIVKLFRRKNLLKKTVISFKLAKNTMQSKHAYSRKFTIFTAWKSLTKENNLLDKYLKECNYQSKAQINCYQTELSSIVRQEFDEETKEQVDIGQLSFADYAKNYDKKQFATLEPVNWSKKDLQLKNDMETTQKDINFLFGCQPAAQEKQSSNDFEVEALFPLREFTRRNQ